MAEYGRRRSPAKRVYWETGIEGSNPSLSVNNCPFCIYRGIRSLSEHRPIREASVFYEDTFSRLNKEESEKVAGISKQDVCDSEQARLKNQFRTN